MNQSKHHIMKSVSGLWKFTLAALFCILTALSAGAQMRTVKGTVYDPDNEPVIGATVKVKGTTRVVATDIDGNFTIEASPKETIAITYIGYKPVEVSAAKTDISVVLESETQNLDEVIVVGYGTQRKATLTGAVSQVSSKEISVTKNENVVNMLSGKIPGVRISQRSSQPGEFDNAIDVRGMGEPLFVVDGIPRDKGYFSRMDPNEIESVSVLKDAAASIYGIRAANGVLLVTTKRGVSQEGKFDITFSFNYGWQNFLYTPETADAATHMLLMNEKQLNNNFGGNYFVKAPVRYTWEQMLEYSSGRKKSTNWSDELFRDNVPQQQYNVSMNGGSDRIQYFFNLGYLEQEGSFRSGSLNYNRWNFRSNVDAQITKDLKAVVQLSGYMDEKNQPATDMWTVYKMAWTYPSTAEAWVNGDHSLPAYDSELGSNTENPVATTNADYTGYNRERHYNFNGALTLQYDIPWVEGLNAKAFYSYDYYSTNDTRYKRAYQLYRQNADGTLVTFDRNPDAFLQRTTYPSYGTVLQLSLNYAHRFGDHNVSAMALYEEQYNDYDSFYAKRNMLLDGEYLIYGETSGQETGAPSIWDKSRRAFVGRVGYDFRGKYMADFSFREDGSSSFPGGARWGFFPAVSAGWRISEESFMQALSPVLSNLKIRGSWGKMGDDSGCGTYPPTVVGYALNQRKLGWIINGELIGGVSPTGVPNPNLTWYTAETYNAGIDFDLWGSKLSGVFEVFERKRSGLFATSAAVIPGHVGVSMPQENINSDKTFGYEFSLSHRNTVAGVNYWVTAQISATKNRWDYFMAGDASNSMDFWYRNDVSGRNKDIWFAYEEGGRFGNYVDIRYHPTLGGGFGQQTLPGDYWYEDWNEDGVIDGNDRHPVATYNLPVFNYGFTFGATWKGIDLSTTWQGVANVYCSYDEVFTEVGPFNGGASLTRYTNRWHTVNVTDDPWNPNTQWISGRYPATGHSFNDGTTGIHDMSYLRLKTLEVGYTLPAKWLKVVGIKDLRVYFNAYNLLTFSKMDDMDPERPGRTGGSNNNRDQGILFYNYPVNRTYNVGATLKF
ncbi:TonB-dependent receptor [bacterium J10(2018)]|nr:TonB-dependent receptor [bacterium J10(2018)]